MPELRLILLVIGAVFILAIVLFEIRRARRNRPLSKVLNETPGETPRLREPTISLPDIHVRHHAAPLPSVELNEAPVIARAEQETLDATAAFPAMVPLAPLTPETTLGVVSTAASSDLGEDIPLHAGAGSEVDGLEMRGADEPREPDGLQMRGANASREADESVDAPFVPPSAEPPAAPIVDWPPESVRRIYSVRVMSVSPERFPGRAVRLALADEGFVHGAFDIYHKPAADGRVVVSASSITKPGTFDPATIDTHRFLGLSLFVVLPGPLAPRAAIDEMFRAAGELAMRLDGSLQDDHGRAVTPEAVSALRETAARAAVS